MAERDELIEALDACLAALESGASLDRVLAGYPALAAELRPLLIAARAVGAGPDLARVPVGAQISSRSQFVAGAAGARLVAVPVPGPKLGFWPRLNSWLAWRPMAGSSLAARAIVTLLVVAAGLGAGGYGAVAASAQSLPGDALYGVKRSVEDTQLLLAPDEQARARLQSEFDARRVHEVLAVAGEHRQVAVDFTGMLISRDGPQLQNWLVSGVAVLVSPQTPVDGVPAAGAQVRVLGMTQASGVVLAQHVSVLAGTPQPTVTPLPPTATASPTATPQAVTTESVGNSSTAAATNAVPVEPSLTPSATLAQPLPDTPEPTDTQEAPATSTEHATETEVHVAPSPSASPKATDGGEHQTPGPTEGGDHEGTPQATQGASGTPRPRTPEPTEGGDHASTSQPTESGGASSSAS